MLNIEPKFFCKRIPKNKFVMTERNVVIALPLESIVIRPEFQRRPIKPHVRRIANDFNSSQVGIPTVVEYLQQMVVIDGMHRLLAMLELGIIWWSFSVHYGMTEQDIYKLFHATNGVRKKLQQIDLFRSGYRSGSLFHKGICDIVAEHHFHIPLMVGERRQPNTIRAYASLESIVKDLGGQKGLDRTFSVVEKCFVADKDTYRLQTRAGNSDFLLGLANLMYRGMFTIQNVTARFASINLQAAEVLDEAAVRNQGTQSHWSYIEKIYDVLKDAYDRDNWRTRTNRTNRRS